MRASIFKSTNSHRREWRLSSSSSRQLRSLEKFGSYFSFQ